MNRNYKKKPNLVEVFGHSPDDLTKEARTLWQTNKCPFVNKDCSKFNHDKTIVYGVCSVTSPYGDVIICPNRLYANNYEVLAKVGQDAFGDIPFLTCEQFKKRRAKYDDCIVALGKTSGKEVQIRGLSMDWVLTHFSGGKPKEYVGIEIQSIDTTGNYRDIWNKYKNLTPDVNISDLPRSRHGLNWANVHKRLIPQLVRKGRIYSESKITKKGLYFVLPDIVYKKFEDIIGSDIPQADNATYETMTVYTYELGEEVPHGQQRELREVRKLRFTLEEFSSRSIFGVKLPKGEELDNAVINTINDCLGTGF